MGEMNMINKMSNLLVFLLENTEIVFHENFKSTKFDKTKRKINKKVEIRDIEGNKHDMKYENNNNNSNDDDDNNNNNNNKINNSIKSNNIQLFTKLLLGIEGLGLHATTQTSNIIENDELISKIEISPTNMNENEDINGNQYNAADEEIINNRSKISLFLDLQSKRVIKAILYKNENVKNIISKKDNDNNGYHNNNNNNNNYNIDNNNSNNNEKIKSIIIDDKNIVRDLGLKFGIESGDYLNGILIGLSGIFGSKSSISIDGYFDSSSSFPSATSTSSSSSSPPSFPPTLPSIIIPSPTLSLSLSSSSLSPLSPPQPSSSPLPSYLTRQLLLSSHRYCTQDWGSPHTLTKIIQSLSNLRIWNQISNTQFSDTISYYKRNLDLIYNDNDIIEILTIFLPFFITKKNEISVINIIDKKNINKLFLSNEINEKTKNEMKFIIKNFVQKVLNDEKIEINNKENNVNVKDDDDDNENENENESSNSLLKKNFLLIIESIKFTFLTEKTFKNENENVLETDDNHKNNNVEDYDNDNKNKIKSSFKNTNAESSVFPTVNKSLKITEEEIIPFNMKRALIYGFSRAFHGFEKKELMSILQSFPTVNILWQDFTVEYGKDGESECEENNEKLSDIQMKIIEIRNAEKNEISNAEVIDKIFTNFGVPNEIKSGKNENQKNENTGNLIIKIEKLSENNPYVKTVTTVNQNISPKYPLFPLWDTLEELRELIPLLDSCSNYIPNVLWQCHKKKITIQTLMVSSILFIY